MADETDKTGADGGQGGYGALVPTPPVYGAPYPLGYPGLPLPSPYGPPLYVQTAPIVDKSEVKFSDAVPAQVRAEINWLIKTAKQNRMPIGVLVTCYRLLLLILYDLETTHRPARRMFRTTALDRLGALRKAGAVTKAVVEEASLLRLEHPGRPSSGGAMIGDPQDATRYVHFLRLLVEVAYEAQAKYRKAQQPAPKTAPQGMTLSVTVGPPSSGSG